MQNHFVLEEFVLRMSLLEVYILGSSEPKRIEGKLSHEFGIAQNLPCVLGKIGHAVAIFNYSGYHNNLIL